MNKIFYKLFNANGKIEFAENNKDIPKIRVIKENKLYIAYNILFPELRESYSTADELVNALGSTSSRINIFDDQTGENIFKSVPV